MNRAALAAIGDLPRLSEPKQSRRARFHQAWYRAERLGITTWGSTPQGRPLGSILPPAAADAGSNFTTESARQLFLQRRQQGWGVDPVRMTSHMTSSQALLVNLLGPLGARPSWLLTTLARVLRRDDLRDLVRWEVEFAPPARSRYLGDMTRLDAFFVVDTAAGLEAIVLELKYTDRFSSRRLDLANNLQYRELANAAQIWHDADAAFADGDVSQLLRCHALGARTLAVDYESLSTTILLLAHPSDGDAACTLSRYRAHLTRTESAAHVALDEFLRTAAAAARSPQELADVSELGTRYLRHDLSEPLWLAHVEQQAMGGRVTRRVVDAVPSRRERP